MTPSEPPQDPLDLTLAQALSAYPADSQALSRAVLSRLAQGDRRPFARAFAPLPLGMTGGALLVLAGVTGYAILPLAGGLELALMLMLTGGL